MELWFEGFTGIDNRITVTKLPEEFSVEAWEAIDQMLNDEPKLDELENVGIYRFTLKVEEGFDTPHENEFGFSIEDYKYLGNYERKTSIQK